MSELEAPSRPGRGQRVTIREVARDAGVSTAAVSKVLRDAYGVSESLRARVRASIERLGYRPLVAARAMRGQSYALGIILSDIRNPFFSDLLAGLNAALERTQYQPMIGIGMSDSLIEQALVDSMVDRQMDGVIMISPHIPTERIVEVAARTPMVLVGHHDPEATAFDTVNNNDRLGAELVVRHLYDTGFRRIVMVSSSRGPTGVPGPGSVAGQRELGYGSAMQALGLSEQRRIVRVPQTLRETQGAIRHLLTGPGRPEALFCWTDFVALEVISVATELGLTIPRDVAIVGYDNSLFCDFAQNDLTSVDQSGQVLGLQCSRLLIERIKGRTTAEHFVIEPRVVPRGSSRAA